MEWNDNWGKEEVGSSVYKGREHVMSGVGKVSGRKDYGM